MKKSKAFTLIELIAVLVILAILALIVTPLVMNIIKKARVSADKRSIDAYGRSIELAIADYLLDKGEFPTNIEQLTIEYTGDEVVCNTTKLNSDSSVYLASCTVGGRTVTGYTYGKEETLTYEAYEIGDEVTYNNVDYYVIKDSESKESTVTLLKAEPLTVSEVNQYGSGHINRYLTSDTNSSYYQKAYDINNDGMVGGVVYYSSPTCGYNGSEWVSDGCKSNYADSEVKYVVDGWAAAKTISTDLVEDSTGYSVRLITYEELLNNFEYVINDNILQQSSDNTKVFMHSNYFYWTMSAVNNSSKDVWYIHIAPIVASYDVYTNALAIRPVITLKKSVLN